MRSFIHPFIHSSAVPSTCIPFLNLWDPEGKKIRHLLTLNPGSKGVGVWLTPADQVLPAETWNGKQEGEGAGVVWGL